MPSYDRAAPLLEDAGGSQGAAAPAKPALTELRCFNCGSYTHNLQVMRLQVAACSYRQHNSNTNTLLPVCQAVEACVFALTVVDSTLTT